MSVAKFISISDNPRQRDTERHAKKAVKWLSKPAETHEVVSIAQLADGRQFKLDGHTRAHLWSNGKIPAPDKVKAVQFDCKSIQEVMELYTHFDNAKAVETATDKVAGACREHRMELKSGLLSRHDFAQALRCVDRGKLTEYELVGKFKKEIEEVDSWGLPKQCKLLGKRSSVHTCIKALAIKLLQVGEPEEEVKDFIVRLVKDLGTMKNGRKDGVVFAREWWAARDADGALSGWGNLNGFLDELTWCYQVPGYRVNRVKSVAGLYQGLEA
jgi:hypothetical protein